MSRTLATECIGHAKECTFEMNTWLPVADAWQHAGAPAEPGWHEASMMNNVPLVFSTCCFLETPRGTFLSLAQPLLEGLRGSTDTAAGGVRTLAIMPRVTVFRNTCGSKTP